MKRIGISGLLLLIMLIFNHSHSFASDEVLTDSLTYFNYFKKELNTGITYSLQKVREQVRTENTNDFEELTENFLRFRWANRNWNLALFKQEVWDYNFEIGPFYGNGTMLDSSTTRFIDTEQKVAGVRAKAAARYSSRFYYDYKNYTIVKVDAWGSYGLLRRDATGTHTDSVGLETPYSQKSDLSKLRYGFEAKAGWGRGRLNPMNHFMTAQYILEKNYERRNFSDREILLLAREIGRIKHARDARTGHDPETEAGQLTAFLNRELMLESPGTMLNDWVMGEFSPRFEGTRWELGPFFNYFNREPDFIFGGYLQFENAKYCNLKWNRNISASLSYNSYKQRDWILLETKLGWSFYPDLKTRYDFGLKYIPGVTVNDIDDFGIVRHNFIPYVNYYSQLSSSYRMDLAFSWRIAANDTFVLPGPEVSVSFYRSKY
ncbi:MAG: hypothetical protein ACQETJ_06705 [Bacteroidota bacterium]